MRTILSRWRNVKGFKIVSPQDWVKFHLARVPGRMARPPGRLWSGMTLGGPMDRLKQKPYCELLTFQSFPL